MIETKNNSFHQCPCSHNEYKNLKRAFGELYDALEDVVGWIEANPKIYEDSTDWQHSIDVANQVLNYWKKSET